MCQPLSITGDAGWEPPGGQARGSLCPRLTPSEAGQGLPPALRPSGHSAAAGPSPVLCSSGTGLAWHRPVSARAAEFCRSLLLGGPAEACSPSAHSGAEQRDSFYVRLCDWPWILSPPYTPCGQRPRPVCSPSRGRTRAWPGADGRSADGVGGGE